jgi:enoyl-CoA hydratase/carnithine racemase
MEKPVIAALHRTCVGMALELALACDFRIATADAALGLPEIAFGIVPDVGGTTRLVRVVGPQRARELILTGKILSAATAARIGLVEEVAADAADLDLRVARLARRLAAHSPIAVGKAKTLVLQSAELDARASFQLEGTVQEVLMRQPDLAERFASAVQFIREAIAQPE